MGNVDLISEGFDAPALPMRDYGSAYQVRDTISCKWAGRAMRPGPDKIALILDIEGSSHELGLPDEEREWSLEDGEVKQKKKKNLIECPLTAARCTTASPARTADMLHLYPSFDGTEASAGDCYRAAEA